MVPFLAGIALLALAGGIWAFAPKSEDVVSQAIRRVGPTASILVASVLVFYSGFYTVEEGTRAVKKTLGDTHDEVVKPGPHWKWFFQEQIPLSVRHTEYTDEFDCKSDDLQRVTVQMTLVYRRIPEQVPAIYERVQHNSETVDVRPQAREVLKAAIARYTAEDIIAKRSELSDDIETGMDEAINGVGLEMIRCSLANIDFDDSYDAKVEGKVVEKEMGKAELQILRKEGILAQIKAVQDSGLAMAREEEARGAAESRKLVAASTRYKREVIATAEALQVQKLGEAQAEVASLKAKALSDNSSVLEYETAVGWSGNTPVFSMRGDSNSSMPYDTLFSQVQDLVKHDAPEIDNIENIEVKAPENIELKLPTKEEIQEAVDQASSAEALQPAGN